MIVDFIVIIFLTDFGLGWSRLASIAFFCSTGSPYIITYVSKTTIRGASVKSLSQALAKLRVNEAGKTAFLLLLFSYPYIRQSSTAPKLRYHHHSSMVEWGSLKRNDEQHQLATFCLHANCIQDPVSFMSRYNFLFPCCVQTSSSFKFLSLGAGAYKES